MLAKPSTHTRVFDLGPKPPSRSRFEPGFSIESNPERKIQNPGTKPERENRDFGPWTKIRVRVLGFATIANFII